MLQLLKVLVQTQPLILRLLVQSRPLFSGEDLVRGKPWHHAKITWHAAKEATDWSAPGEWKEDETGPEDESSAAAAIAWHADYLDTYLYNPLWWAAGGLDRFKAALLHQNDLIKLHFDDTTSTRQIQILWKRYLGGTVAGLLWAAERNDVDAARNIVGTGLHALQDFYSHSNWVDDPERRKKTWLGLEPQARDALHLYAGAYEDALQAQFKPHGKYALDCTIMRRLVPPALMDAACGAISPLSNSPMCRRWHECKGAASPRPETVAGVPIPPDIVYVEPPGIALDSTWMAKLAVHQRDLPDRGQVTDEELGKCLFEAAWNRAREHTTAWLEKLNGEMAARGYKDFWKQVKTEPRSGDRQIPGPPELANMLGRYNGDLEQWEEPQRTPFNFLSTGEYPPHPDGRDEGWFLRLDINTADEALAGTNADIFADVDGKSFLLDRMHERVPQGGLDEVRLLEHNDFEAGSMDTYVVGPFAQRPQQLALRNSAASTLGIVQALWEDIKRIASEFLDDAWVFLLSIIGGNADYVGADQRSWSWAELDQISLTGRTNPAAPIFAKHSGKVMDVAEVSTANGAAIHQWNLWGGDNQLFRLEPVGGGYHRLVAEHSDKVLDVEGASTDNGAPIVQWDWLGDDNQLFRIEPTGDGYHRLVAKHSGKVVDVAGASTENGTAIHQWDWLDDDNQKWRVLEPFTLHMYRGEEGEYEVSGTLSVEATPTGVRAHVTLKTLYCRRESKWDMGTGEDEPFVVALVTSPASWQTLRHRTTGIKDVNTGDMRDITHEMVVDVPRYGGLILAAQVWESDIETIADRDKILDEFARGFDERTINERSRFFDAVGQAVAPDWKVASLDAYAFRRGEDVEVAHLVTNRQLNRWVDAGQSVAVPLDGMNRLSLREIAGRHFGITGGFSVVRDIFGVPQIVGSQSLRAKLESMTR